MDDWKAKIPTLKHKLVNATAFSEIAEYFLADFGGNPDFVRASDPSEDQVLLQGVAQIVSRMVGGRAGALEAHMYRVPEAKLVHGSLGFAEWMGVVFYFEDLERGLLALGKILGPTQFVRFSMTEVPRSASGLPAPLFNGAARGAAGPGARRSQPN